MIIDKITTDVRGNTILIPPGANKDQESRLKRYVRWLNNNGKTWFDNPDINSYCQYLMTDGRERGEGRLAASTIEAHLSTVRSRYAELLVDNRVRDALEIAIRRALMKSGEYQGPADVEALVNRIFTRLRNAINPVHVKVDRVTVRDSADQKYVRLTPEQASALLYTPGLETLPGLRDTALMGLMLATGIRAAETSALLVMDLRQKLGGELSLHIRRGKGNTERLIPYGAMDWVLVLLDVWLKSACIEYGPVFRGFYKGYKKIRTTALTTRAIQDIVAAHPVLIDGELVGLTPHDLRRTYAKMMYNADVDLVKIQQNMGHEDSKTTLGYIGTLDASDRRPPALFRFDIDVLNKLYNGLPE